MMLSVSLVMSLNWTFLTVLEIIMLPYGYTSNDASYFGFSNNIIGIFGGVTASLILRKWPIYHKMTISIIIGSSITYFLWFVIITQERPADGYKYALALMLINGFITIPVQTYSLEYCCELAPEYDEAVSGGFQLAIANVLGFAQITYMQWISEDDVKHPRGTMEHCTWITMGFLVLSLGLMMGISSKKKV